MKCCGNCFWSFTEKDELSLEGYDENDINKPKAGDCLIGQIHNENYYCDEHQYIDGMEEYKNYVLYDELYLGKGYLIITTLDDEIIKLVKISNLGEDGFQQYFIRAYEKNSKDNPEDSFRRIIIEANENDPLYKVIRNFANNTNMEEIQTIDLISQGKNNIKTEYTLFEAELIISKDIYGVKYSTDYIDILIGDNDTCKYYNAFSTLFDELTRICIGQTKNEDIKKLLKK